MKILFVHEGLKASSRLWFGHNTSFVGSSFAFVTKGDRPCEAITINKDSPTWRMDYCHEVAHVLTAAKFETIHPWFANHKELIQTFKWEVVAWRLAKSFCKKKYWTEARAILGLQSYAKQIHMKIDWKKFRTTELNKGTKL